MAAAPSWANVDLVENVLLVRVNRLHPGYWLARLRGLIRRALASLAAGSRFESHWPLPPLV